MGHCLRARLLGLRRPQAAQPGRGEGPLRAREEPQAASSVWPHRGSPVPAGVSSRARASPPPPRLRPRAPLIRAPAPRAPRAGRAEGKVGERAASAGESVNGRPGGSRALARPRHAGAGSADDRGAWGRRRAPLARQVLRLEMSPLVVARSPPERARRAAAQSPRGRPAAARRHRR